MFVPIQKILPKTINKIGIKREVEAALICEKYRKLAPRLIHANALQHTFPKYFRGKTLVIGVENSGWAHQININKDLLLAAINEDLKSKKVFVIKTKTVQKESKI